MSRKRVLSEFENKDEFSSKKLKTDIYSYDLELLCFDMNKGLLKKDELAIKQELLNFKFGAEQPGCSEAWLVDIDKDIRVHRSGHEFEKKTASFTGLAKDPDYALILRDVKESKIRAFMRYSSLSGWLIDHLCAEKGFGRIILECFLDLCRQISPEIAFRTGYKWTPDDKLGYIVLRSTKSAVDFYKKFGFKFNSGGDPCSNDVDTEGENSRMVLCIKGSLQEKTLE